jgi:SHS2 domain-containing protein
MADVAFEVEANSLNELFELAGLAMMNILVEDLSEIELLTKKSISISADSIEMLLYNFLQELIFIKDTEMLVFRNFNVKVDKKDDKYHLTSEAEGEEIKPSKHKMVVDPKAVTMHKFEVKRENGKWLARVVVDV